MNSITLAVIGAGNMGSSLISGLIKNHFPAKKIIACDPSKEKRAALEKNFHIETTASNEEAAEKADVILFAVKPQLFREIAKNLAPIIQKRNIFIISVAAGIRTTHISHWLGEKIAIVRTMPNTPALIGCGATALYANTHVSSQQRNIAESIMRAVGIIVWLKDEALMDAVTALSGSGPAYFFLMMEILQQIGESMGLDAETSRLLTLETGLGAIKMAIESDASLLELRQRVTSPQGTTEKAIHVLEENHVRELFNKALYAAKHRSEELGQLLDTTENH